jgi:nucleoside-diphosphate-sugar epimerase
MTTVAVTGSSGYLGRVLLEQLGTHPSVTRVIGIDVAEPKTSTRNLEFYRMDIRSPDLGGVLQGANVVVHLAFTVDDDPAETRDVNVGGTRLVLESALHAGARKVVVASSTMVYGAHPDNDYPLTETSPLRPARDLPFSGHSAEAEAIARAFTQTHPDLEVAVLRFSAVFGPNLSGTGRRFVESSYAFGVKGYDVPAQTVHESDAARALLVAAVTDLQGVYNVCASDAVPGERVAEILGQRRIELDADRAEHIAERLARFRLGAVPSAFLPFLMYPCVASNAKLTSMGFSIEHTAEEALLEGAEARKGWVAVGDVRFRPRRVAIVGGAVAAVLLGGAVRKRRSRRS